MPHTSFASFHAPSWEKWVPRETSAKSRWAAANAARPSLIRNLVSKAVSARRWEWASMALRALVLVGYPVVGMVVSLAGVEPTVLSNPYRVVVFALACAILAEAFGTRRQEGRSLGDRLFCPLHRPAALRLAFRRSPQCRSCFAILRGPGRGADRGVNASRTGQFRRCAFCAARRRDGGIGTRSVGVRQRERNGRIAMGAIRYTALAADVRRPQPDLLGSRRLYGGHLLLFSADRNGAKTAPKTSQSRWHSAWRLCHPACQLEGTDSWRWLPL